MYNSMLHTQCAKYELNAEIVKKYTFIFIAIGLIGSLGSRLLVILMAKLGLVSLAVLFGSVCSILISVVAVYMLYDVAMATRLDKPYRHIVAITVISAVINLFVGIMTALVLGGLAGLVNIIFSAIIGGIILSAIASGIFYWKTKTPFVI